MFRLSNTAIISIRISELHKEGNNTAVAVRSIIQFRDEMQELILAREFY